MPGYGTAIFTADGSPVVVQRPGVFDVLDIDSLIFSPSGQYVLAGGCNERIGQGFFCGSPEIRWYDVNSGELLHQIETRSYDVEVSADGSFFVTAGEREHIIV
jgi:hypothetical protein